MRGVLGRRLISRQATFIRTSADLWPGRRRANRIARRLAARCRRARSASLKAVTSRVVLIRPSRARAIASARTSSGRPRMVPAVVALIAPPLTRPARTGWRAIRSNSLMSE
jgi:hypothetical protein